MKALTGQKKLLVRYTKVTRVAFGKKYSIEMALECWQWCLQCDVRW